MDKANIRKIIRVTDGPKHHFFGFHDLLATNADEDKLLSLEVEDISRPPLPKEKAGVGYVDIESREYVRLGETNAFNYPQGARMQWIDNVHFIVNNQVGNHWGADIYDADARELVNSIDYTCHCLSKDKTQAFGINYARLHRLGGYGYIGLDDQSADKETPKNDGIFVTDIGSNETRLLVSIDEVANCDSITSAHNGFHHYVTHLVLSPNGKRIAFLHRFFLADGGIRTRLMTVGVDGAGLRCLACGFLSHFDWRDDTSLFIWGRSGSSIDAVRSNPLFSNPLVKPLLSMAKGVARKVLKKSKGMSMHFLMASDSDSPTVTPFGIGKLTCDGHPMCNPFDRDLCLCDTYPDENKERTLFLYRFSTDERTDLGRFRMIDELPKTELIKEYSSGVDERIMKMFSPELFSFTRSGLHCDLHPRWSSDGKMAIFDSIHEGTRQIYTCKISLQ